MRTIVAHVKAAIRPKIGFGSKFLDFTTFLTCSFSNEKKDNWGSVLPTPIVWTRCSGVAEITWLWMVVVLWGKLSPILFLETYLLLRKKTCMAKSFFGVIRCDVLSIFKRSRYFECWKRIPKIRLAHKFPSPSLVREDGDAQ